MNDKDSIFLALKELVLPNKKTVFELGAAGGEDTASIVESIRFVDGSYYAVEPEPRNIPSLSKVASGIRNCHALPFAVGNRSSRIEFLQSSHSDPSIQHTHSGSLKKPLEHLKIYPWCRFDTSIQVQMVRLDDLSKILGVNHVDLIWSDIQGADDWMIEGGIETLKRTDYLLTECFEERLYEGQLNANEMSDRLPGQWQIIRRWEHDILFMRKS